MLSNSQIVLMNRVLEKNFPDFNNHINPILTKDDLYNVLDQIINNYNSYININVDGKSAGRNNGNKGYKVFNAFVQYLLYRNLANYDSMVLLTADKGCLTEDSLIEMPRDLSRFPDGIPMKLLLNQTNFKVYSFNRENNRIELKMAKSCEFAKFDDVYEIHFNNGEKIQATKDHPFMTTDKKYKQVKDMIWTPRSKKAVTHLNKGPSEVGLKVDKFMAFQRYLKKTYPCISYSYFENSKDKVYKHNELLFLESQTMTKEERKFKKLWPKNGNLMDLRLSNLIKVDRNYRDEKYYESLNPMIQKDSVNEKLKIPDHIISKTQRQQLSEGVRVLEIKYIGKKAVYDIVGVQDNANFIANKMIVSNTGKSSFAIMMAREWCKTLGIKFNPQRHIAYTAAQLSERVDSLNKFEPLVCDESQFASSSEWNKRENRELKKKLGQIRTRHLLFIMCFPLKINKLDKVYLESFCNYWVDLFGRGIGALYVKDKNPAMEPWRIRDFKDLGSYTEFTNASTIKKKLMTHPNFWQIVKAPKPPKAFYEKYLITRESNVYNSSDVFKSVDKGDMLRALLIMTLKDMLQKDATMSISRLLVYFETVYGITIDKKTFDNIIEDSKMLVEKIKENKGMV